MHEAPMSTSTPPSYCTLELIPGVIGPLKIRKHELTGQLSDLQKMNFLYNTKPLFDCHL